jgi:hypothetical protein
MGKVARPIAAFSNVHAAAIQADVGSFIRLLDGAAAGRDPSG